jgi:molybdopterin-guanine dinucleotide biosynthesis protein A
LKVRIVPDRIPGEGPLQAAVSACRKLRGERVALLGGDMPYVTAEALQLLRLAWQPGDEAVVARHDGRWEPLAALYDRKTLAREGEIALRRGQRAMHALLERVRRRGVALPACLFANVNAACDLPERTPA